MHFSDCRFNTKGNQLVAAITLFQLTKRLHTVQHSLKVSFNQLELVGGRKEKKREEKMSSFSSFTSPLCCYIRGDIQEQRASRPRPAPCDVPLHRSTESSGCLPCWHRRTLFYSEDSKLPPNLHATQLPLG